MKFSNQIHEFHEIAVTFFVLAPTYSNTFLVMFLNNGISLPYLSSFLFCYFSFIFLLIMLFLVFLFHSSI